MTSHEIFENVVATFVDIASIMVAYAVGIHQFNFLVGVAYAILDAILVVWMRKPLSNLIRSALEIHRAPWSRRNAFFFDLTEST
jgi:hypothetical protein